MPIWVKKLISTFLTLAVLLAPLEFSMAHDSMMQGAADMEMMQHADAGHDQHQTQADDSGDNCKSEGFCKNCVYCSPAIGSALHIQLDRPRVMPVMLTFSGYSIDLPLDIRPPKTL